MYNLMDMMHLPHHIATRLSFALVSSLHALQGAPARDDVPPPVAWNGAGAPVAALSGHALPLSLVAGDGHRAVFDRPAQPIGMISATGAFRLRLADGEFLREGAVYRIAPVK